MSRENAEARGRRLVGEGRLTVEYVGENVVRAICRGSGEVHDVTWSDGGGWRCSCPARGRCSHVVALQLVVVVKPSLPRVGT